MYHTSNECLRVRRGQRCNGCGGTGLKPRCCGELRPLSDVYVVIVFLFESTIVPFGCLTPGSWEDLESEVLDNGKKKKKNGR